MATPRSQRIGIWIIAIVMTIGTIGSFAVMILANQNNKIDQANYQKQVDEYTKQQKLAEEERQKSLRPLEGYAAEAFDASAVTELSSDVLVEGDGAELAANSAVSVNYFGWTADGKIFDSTNIDGKTTPNDNLTLDGVIAGWTKGLTGKKVGSVVKLTIPTDLAYGSTAAQSGRPAGPLEFIVQIIAIK